MSIRRSPRRVSWFSNWHSKSCLKTPARFFSYQPLPSKDSVRLLQLLPGTALACSLEAFEPQDAPKYDALSYTWGHAMPAYSEPLSAPAVRNEEGVSIWKKRSDGLEKVHPIACDGEQLRVTENLKDALHMLRGPSLRRNGVKQSARTWIDAICIDQGNVRERNQQVVNMREIYKNARNVIIWLGEEDAFVTEALEILELLSQVDPALYHKARYVDFFRDTTIYDTIGIPPISIQQWLSFLAFINRPYFERAWVVQELAVAESATMICGRHVVPWEWMSKAIDFLRETTWAFQLNLTLIRTMTDLSVLPEAHRRLLDPKISLGKSAVYLGHTRVNMENKASQSRHHPQRKHSFQYLLRVHRRTEATDPKDKIYAFLGLATPTLQLRSGYNGKLQADYEQPVQQIYQDVAAGLILTSRNLGHLEQVEDPSLRRIRDLPSWVPDYSVTTAAYGGLHYRGPCRWHASGNLPCKLKGSRLYAGFLDVHGMHLDTIIATSSLHNGSPEQYWLDVGKIMDGMPDYYEHVIGTKNVTMPRLSPSWSAYLPAATSTLLPAGGNHLKGLRVHYRRDTASAQSTDHGATSATIWRDSRHPNYASQRLCNHGEPN